MIDYIYACTGISPFELLFGRAPKYNLHPMTDSECEDSHLSEGSFRDRRDSESEVYKMCQKPFEQCAWNFQVYKN